MTGLDSVREAIEDAEEAAGATAFTAWMGAAAAIGLAKDRQAFLPDSVFRSLLVRALQEAESSARDLDWAERDRFERERRDLILTPKFQRSFEDLMGYSPLAELEEPAAYVGTVSTDTGNAEEQVERWLAANGFRRNAIAYLKYRYRESEREYEQGSWTYRSEIKAEKQLHVRLFDGADPGTVDLYAHREPSILEGEEHFGRPDYRRGVCEIRPTLESWATQTDGVRFRRVDPLPTGDSPAAYECEDIAPVPRNGNSA